MFATIVPTLLYVLTIALFIAPFIIECWSPPSTTLKILSPILRVISILVNIALPAEARSLFKTDKIFVFYEYLLFNLSLISLPFIYFSDYITVPVTLITSPAILVIIEAVFFYLITYESSVDLGYFSRFHQGLWLTLKALGAGVSVIGAGVSVTLEGLSAGLSVCCGHSGGEELSAPLSRPRANPPPSLQASPPPYFDFMAIDAVVLRDEGKMV